MYLKHPKPRLSCKGCGLNSHPTHSERLAALNRVPVLYTLGAYCVPRLYLQEVTRQHREADPEKQALFIENPPLSARRG